MLAYRIYRIKESASQQFRWAPHVSGATQVKRKDYDEGGEVEAGNQYGAWIALRDAGTPLRVGDILEQPDGDLSICKYVGFDVAQWIVPEVKTGLESTPPASGPALAPPASAPASGGA
ncbi:MAG: hypothetical protein ABIZ80_04245 [Bryobacteraceae bacterium]